MKPYVQWTIAVLIMGNFITNIVEKQIDPFADDGILFPACAMSPTPYSCPWFVIETVWNVIFILELVWNMWGCFYITTIKGHFFCSGWNCFDFLVVATSLPLMTGAAIPGLGMLRMLRAFRVFRLFKRVKSLNKIIVALVKAVPGIINSFVVMIIFMCIFAILSVDFFGKFGEPGTFVNIYNESVTLETQRGLTYGAEYYGTFLRALFTLFQVCSHPWP